MKKISLAGIASSLLVASLSAHSACLSFAPYCDSLELTLSGTDITGTWINLDCNGLTLPVDGQVVSPTEAQVACGAQCDAIFNTAAAFVIDIPLDGTLDMYVNDPLLEPGPNPGWEVWFADLEYTTTPGNCPTTTLNSEGYGVPSWSRALHQ